MRLCRAEEIEEGEGRGFVLGSGPQQRRVFVIRWDGTLHAYLNACPHIGTPLDFLPDQFLTRDGRHLLCSTHGAMFEIASGLCIHGPCCGQSLKPVPVTISDGQIVLRKNS